MWFSCLPILTGSAEGQVILGGIAKRLLIAYIIGNISAKKYQNPFTCIRVIASQRWDVFWDTVYLYCRRSNTNDCLHLQENAKTAINDARLAPTPKPELEIWRKPHKRTVPLSVGGGREVGHVAWTEAYLRTKWYPDASSRLAITGFMEGC